MSEWKLGYDIGGTVKSCSLCGCEIISWKGPATGPIREF